MVERSKLINHSAKWIITITGATCIAYFTGPYTAMVAREAFSLGYGYLYGIPSFFTLENLTVYSPMREHVGHIAYNYGAGTLALISMPFLYKSLDMIKWWGKKANPLEENHDIKLKDQNINDLNSKIDDLAHLMRQSHSLPQYQNITFSKPQLLAIQNKKQNSLEYKNKHGLKI